MDRTPSTAPLGDTQALQSVLGGGRVDTAFQPIVELASGAVVGYEALTRGPAGPLHRPDDLFAAAHRAGRLAELDRICQRCPVHSAVRAGIGSGLALFVNVEPATIDTSTLRVLGGLVDALPDRPQMVLEVTERALVSRPAELLRAAELVRRLGWRVALDDVGADDQSLTFLALLRPDIIKLDMQLIQHRPSRAIAAVMDAVNAHTERTGAVVVAEGIETDRHAATALAMGATLGQGYLYGRPTTDIQVLPPVEPRSMEWIGPGHSTPAPSRSPLSCLPKGTALRRSTKPLLRQLSMHLEAQAGQLAGSTGMLVTVFQQRKYFTPDTAARYQTLARRVGYIAAMTAAQPTSPLAGEWVVAVLSPHYAAALLARELPDRNQQGEAVNEFAVTYDRDTISRVIETLLTLTAPPPDATQTPTADATAAPGWLFTPLFQGSPTTPPTPR